MVAAAHIDDPACLVAIVRVGNRNGIGACPFPAVVVGRDCRILCRYQEVCGLQSVVVCQYQILDAVSGRQHSGIGWGITFVPVCDILFTERKKRR